MITQTLSYPLLSNHYMSAFYSQKISKKGKNRLYCSRNSNCAEAEKALTTYGVDYVKLECDEKEPVLVTGFHTCKGLDAILSYTFACHAIKTNYSLDWE